MHSIIRYFCIAYIDVYMEEIQAYGPVDTQDPPSSPPSLSTSHFGYIYIDGHQHLLSFEVPSASGRGGYVGPMGGQPACACTAYKWPLFGCLHSSHTHTIQPSSSKFQTPVPSLVVHLIKVLLKLGRDKNIEGRSSIEIWLREKTIGNHND